MPPQSSFLSSSCSSSFSYSFTYDVFISFRGSDTRHGFTGNLHKALCDKGIRAFIDDEDLQRGNQIIPSLLKAIQHSRIAILVFSPNYASSSFCLDELSHIMEFVNGYGRLVLPVFYDVDPSDVRHQKGTFAEAMARHQDRFKDEFDKVHKWREALRQAADLSGEHFKLGKEYEHKFIMKIVKEISKRINRVPLHVADYPVGLESRVQHVNWLLKGGLEGDSGVLMVGIYGVGGIGKSTLARAVYNSIADQFDSLCYLENVIENSDKHGLEYLQEMLLSKIIGKNNFKLTGVYQGIQVIKERLSCKKVLLVLDDVDNLKQLQKLVGSPDWFGSGSRVIITTRDKQLVASHGNWVVRRYEVQDLNDEDALELLSWNALKGEVVDPIYMIVLRQATTFCCRLPLALELIGTNLFSIGRSVEVWRSALAQYKSIPNKDIQKILKKSYDSLDDYQQKFFLDIAFYLKGCDLAEVENILQICYDVCPKYGIQVLIEKSLIKIDEDGRLTLHDLIQDMGKEIVRQESPEEPGKRSRLCITKDIIQVLENNGGTSQIQIIVLDIPKDVKEEVKVEWDGEAFKKMRNLKTLIVRNAIFSQGPKFLPNNLIVLEWWGYPSNYFPSSFDPKNLCKCELPHANLISLKLNEKSKFMTLTMLRLDNSAIEEIPDVSCAPNLVKLSFRCCFELTKVHESVGLLDKLRVLDADHCWNLKSFPCLMLPSLERLDLSDCTSLERFPEILGDMKHIKVMILRVTGINELPSSLAYLTNLTRLEIWRRSSGIFQEEKRETRLIQLPGSISLMPRLEEVSIMGYNEVRFLRQDQGEEQAARTSVIASLADSVTFRGCYLSDKSILIFLAGFPHVEFLDLSYCDFTAVPECIKKLYSLKRLLLNNCEKLVEVEGVPPNIEELSLINCGSLNSSSRSMLINEAQRSHWEEALTFILPGSNVSRFDFKNSGSRSVGFWFRNKLPMISFCCIIEKRLGFGCQAHHKITINGHQQSSNHFSAWELTDSMEHVIIFNPGRFVCEVGNNEEDQLFQENEWNYLDYTIPNLCSGIREIGIYVDKDSISSMEDIRFDDGSEWCMQPRMRHPNNLLALPIPSCSTNVQQDNFLLCKAMSLNQPPPENVDPAVNAMIEVHPPSPQTPADAAVLTELQSLTLSAEHVALLGPFFSRFPLMRLTTTPRHRSFAYGDLGDFLVFISNTSLAEISGSDQKKFMGLVTELKDFFPNHVWLDGLVAQVEAASSSEDSLLLTQGRIQASRERIDAEEQRLTAEIDRHNKLLEELRVDKARLAEQETLLRSRLQAPLFRL